MDLDLTSNLDSHFISKKLKSTKKNEEESAFELYEKLKNTEKQQKLVEKEYSTLRQIYLDTIEQLDQK